MPQSKGLQPLCDILTPHLLSAIESGTASAYYLDRVYPCLARTPKVPSSKVGFKFKPPPPPYSCQSIGY